MLHTGLMMERPVPPRDRIHWLPGTELPAAAPNPKYPEAAPDRETISQAIGGTGFPACASAG